MVKWLDMKSNQLGNVRDWHDPRNPDCPHNQSVESDCACKRKVYRKPYRVIRVDDPTVTLHKVSGKIVAEVHPNGRLILRELGHRTRYTTTVGTILERLIFSEAMKAAKARKAKRKGRK